MSDNIIEKLPPQNIEAETTLLGGILIDKDSIIRVIDIVREYDFYKDAHRYIYQAIEELYAKHEAIDIITVSNKLETKSLLDLIGGRTYLAKIANSVTTSSNIEHYANIVQRKATLRRLITVSAEIGEMGYKENEDVEILLDEAERKLFNVSQKFAKNVFQPIDRLLSEAFDRIDELHRQSGKMRGIPTGYRDLDNYLSGLQKSDLIIIAARPSVGKTTFALDIARQAAVNSKASIGIFSLEMGKEQLVDRLLCAQANISLWKMRTGHLSDSDDNNDFARISEAMGQLSEAKIFIDDTPGCTVMDIRTKCRRLQMERGLDVIIIDYLQLMQGRGTYGENRVQEVAEITRGLKGIARELNVPVIALSQLSRAVEMTKPAIPKLAHLRESGSIEQDADIVMFIYRKSADRNYNKEDLPEDERHSGEIHIAKHRNGPTGTVYLYFDENTVSYKNLERSREAPPEF